MMGGDSSVNSSDYYTGYCEPETNNLPLPRTENRASWSKKGKFFWFYGGYYLGTHSLSDMWYYDLDNKIWIWVNGDTLNNHLPFYGNQGEYSINNHPGARSGSVSWSDYQNNLWLYGGHYYNGSSTIYYGDLWKFIPDECEFISLNEIPLNENEIKISPNPFSDHTYFSFPPYVYNHNNLFFYSIMGQEVYKIRVDQDYVKILRNQLAPGVYIYKIESMQGNLKIGKVIIE